MADDIPSPRVGDHAGAAGSAGADSALAHERQRQHWRQEMDSAALFEGLAEIERHPRRDRAYRRLAEVERRHAALFAAEWARAGVPLPPFRPSARTRWLLRLARVFGTAAVLPRIALLERRDARSYAVDFEPWYPKAEERENALWLAEFATQEASEAAKRWLLRFRRTVLAVVGGALFATSWLLARNVQLEGLWFGLLTGVTVGPVIHYALGKLAVPLGLGRVWCGWACWTAAVLDQLPHRQSGGWPTGPARHLRGLHLLASLALVATLVLGFGYRGGAVGAHAGAWFVAGNLLYWALGAALAFAWRDNRAFCKLLCPVSPLLRQTARPALVKVAGDTADCRACASRACTTLCPMDIRIPDYVAAGKRVLSSECIMCQQCVAVCPPNTLRLSLGFDLGGLELLEPRPPARVPVVGPVNPPTAPG